MSPDGRKAEGRLLWPLGMALVVLITAVALIWARAGSPEAPGPAPAPERSTAGGPLRPPQTDPSRPPAASPECDAPGRQRVTSYAGAWRERINDPYPAPDRTYDLHKLRHVGYGTATRYAITIANPGSGWTSSRQCLLGGVVASSVDRGRTWADLESNYNGDAVDIGIESDWAVVDGIRVDNTYDAIAAQGPAGAKLIVRNAYLSDIRDDCVENDDEPKSLTVEDSLLDGCFTGISERPGETRGPPRADATTTLDGVLLYVKPQAYGTDCRYPRACTDGRAAFGLFKWSETATPRLLIRDSVLRVDRYSAYGPSEMLFPPGATAENSVLVWRGPGPYPAPLPPGMQVTTDVRVWDQARATWLCRHGQRRC